MNKIKWIADISSNHCNNLQLAKDLIYAAKEAGADYAKFQYWETENFINKKAFENLKLSHQSKWKKSVYDVYKQYQVPEDWIPILYDECNKNEIEFLLSCYEISKIDIFDQYVKAWKIGSGDIDYLPLLRKVAEKSKPIMLAVGASKNWEIFQALDELTMKSNVDIILMQCNTNYSSNDNENIKYLNLQYLNYLKTMRKDFNYNNIKAIGLSDHTKSDIPIVYSVINNIKYIERHFKLKDNDSPDSSFSLNFREWKHMMSIANQTLLAIGSGIKNVMGNEQQTRVIQRRSKKDWKRPDVEYLNKI